MKPLIRPAQPADARAWLELRRAFWSTEDNDHVTASEEWGRSLGCREFASDTQLDNEQSAVAHRALRFAEVGPIRCFRKDL